MGTFPLLPAPISCGRASLAFALSWRPGRSLFSQCNREPGQYAATGQLSFRYFCKMFLPKENFVPTVTRTLLRPPFNMFEKKS